MTVAFVLSVYCQHRHSRLNAPHCPGRGDYAVEGPAYRIFRALSFGGGVAFAQGPVVFVFEVGNDVGLRGGAFAGTRARGKLTGLEREPLLYLVEIEGRGGFSLQPADFNNLLLRMPSFLAALGQELGSPTDLNPMRGEIWRCEKRLGDG